jgi:hypothetical protein
MKFYWLVSFVFFSALTEVKALPLALFFSLENNFAAVSGYSQIPRGGQPGTSSIERPSFKESGIYHENFYHLEGGVQYEAYYASLQYQRLAPQGEQILNDDLVTHSQFIPAGRTFSMDIHYDWYVAEIGKQFDVHRWQCSPFLQANWVKYHYAFSALPQQSTRVFSLGGLTVGGDLRFYITKQFSTALKAAVTVPLSRLRIKTAQLNLYYDISVTRHLLISPTCGISFIYVDYQDRQPLPNHVHYQGWPTLKVGVAVSLI